MVLFEIFGVILTFIHFSYVSCSDLPCASKWISPSRLVCVCNSTYCDTVTRNVPDAGKYVAYTTSKAGLRFQKSTGELQPNVKNADGCSPVTIVLDPDKKYQTIEGFGGAATDAAGIHFKNMSQPLQRKFIDSYFSNQGLQYNMIRTPIGGSDFSTHPYAYNEYPINDSKLSNFSLSYEDLQYKLPLIRGAMNVSTAPIHVLASTWSPPPWMKTNDAFVGANRLKAPFYQTYADYHLRFIQKYQEQGVPIWGITTTNEPLNGVIPMRSFNDLGWTAESMGKWIAENLGPTIRNSTFSKVKILCADDQRATLPYYFNKVIEERPDALRYIDGVAVHYYTDFITPASILTEVMKNHPDKFLLATEGCEGSFTIFDKKVELGLWTRARNYIRDIISDLNHNVVGWIDWNLCLDKHGGPNWALNFVDSPIIVFPENGEFVKQPMFYAMGHFSKFIPRGSKRISVKGKRCWLRNNIDTVAFLTPNNTIVTVLYNDGVAKTVVIRIRDKQATLDLEATSVTTVEISL